MSKTTRPIRRTEDPSDEKIVENHIDHAHQVGARFTSLFEGSRHEILSAIPVAPPVGYKKQPSMVDHIRGLVRSEHLRHAAASAGAETFEEADDFEVGDDYDPTSPYEGDFDSPLSPPTSSSDASSLKPGTPPEGVGSPAATPPAPPPSPAPTPPTTAS